MCAWWLALEQQTRPMMRPTGCQTVGERLSRFSAAKSQFLKLEAL
jgi:hypothetical protein